jgi:hypothetical protein
VDCFRSTSYGLSDQEVRLVLYAIVTDKDLSCYYLKLNSEK